MEVLAFVILSFHCVPLKIPTILFAERLRATGSTVFLYELDQDSNGTLADFYPHPFPYDGSSHTDDIMSVMNHN